MFSEKLILIVEDDVYTATDLANAVEDANGRVVGPFAYVSEALLSVSSLEVDAAIVDAQLCDRDVTPLALLLAQKQVPFVIHSGTGSPTALAGTHPDLPVLMKPSHPRHVIATLLSEMNAAGRARQPGTVPAETLPRPVLYTT